MNFSLVDSGIPCRSFRAVIVGSGAAGYNAARKLYDLGVHDIAIITEGEKMGTSRNTGSDKQTYYKLTLAGGDGDSVSDMAETLFSGGAMHGDIALAQAAGRRAGKGLSSLFHGRSYKYRRRLSYPPPVIGG